MATKAQKLTAIRAANKRVQRMKSAGYTKGSGFQTALYEISKARNSTPWEVEGKRKKIRTVDADTGKVKTKYQIIKKGMLLKTSAKMTAKELNAQYKAAQKILSPYQMTLVSEIKKDIHSKTVKTMMEKYGLPDTALNKKAFYNLLNSPDFKRLSETYTSDMVVRAVRESLATGNSIKGTAKNMHDLLEYASNGTMDAYYTEQGLAILTKNSKMSASEALDQFYADMDAEAESEDE